MVLYWFQVISECIIRWWNWLHTEKEADSGSSDKSLGNCPVCRKVVHASDIEHVLGLVGATQSSQQVRASH